SFAAATICMARVIFRVAFTDAMRFLRSFKLAMVPRCPPCFCHPGPASRRQAQIRDPGENSPKALCSKPAYKEPSALLALGSPALRSRFRAHSAGMTVGLSRECLGEFVDRLDELLLCVGRELLLGADRLQDIRVLITHDAQQLLLE